MKQDYDPSVEWGCTVSTMSLPVFILWFLTAHDRYDRHLLHSSPASGELYIQPSTIESVERVQFKLEGKDFFLLLKPTFPEHGDGVCLLCQFKGTDINSGTLIKNQHILFNENFLFYY